jgi:hypothetical protein
LVLASSAEAVAILFFVVNMFKTIKAAPAPATAPAKPGGK